MTGASLRRIWRGSSASALALAAGLGALPSGPAIAGAMSFTVTIEQLTSEWDRQLPDGGATKAPTRRTASASSSRSSASTAG